MAANHLSTAVSELPEYIAKKRTLGAVHKGCTQKSGEGIYNADGSIRTGYITNWNSSSKEDKNKVFAEKKRLKAKRLGKDSDKPKETLNASEANQLKQLIEQNKRFKRQIKALKCSNPTDTTTDDSKKDQDAGDLSSMGFT